MKKILTGALASLTVAGALAAAAPASARTYHHHDNSGAAVAAGIAGLAIGAALASGHDGYYDRPYYGSYYGAPAYYSAPPPAYYAGPRYYSYRERCHSEWRWDRYYGGYVRVRACY
jgi:hypothetical protein